MNDYTRKKDYFYQVKQLIIDMLDNVTDSFESCRDPKAIDKAIRFMDQYYDCIQYVKSDYLPNELKFNNNRIIGKSDTPINQVMANNGIILSCSNDALIHTQQGTYHLETPEMEIYTGLILRDGRILIGGDDKILRVYKHFKLSKQIEGFLKCISTLIASFDEQIIGVCTFTSQVQIFNNQLDKLYTIHSQQGIVYSLTFSAQNHYIAAACKKGVSVYDLTDSPQITQQIMHTSKVRAVAFSRKQKFLAATQKNHIILYHYYVEDFKKYQTLMQHSESVNCLSFYERGLISGSDDCTICLWSSTIKGYWICHQTISTDFCVNSISVCEEHLYCDSLLNVLEFY